MSPKSSANQSLTVAELSNVFAITSNSSGNFANVIGNNLASFIDSTSYTAIYDEYRCLSMRAEFVPNLSGGGQAPSGAPVLYAVAAGVVDNDNSAALTTLSSAVDYESVKLFSLDKRMVLSWKMNGTTQSAFLNNNGTATVWFKYFCTGLTGSQPYGQVIVKALFQFRGRI